MNDKYRIVVEYLDIVQCIGLDILETYLMDHDDNEHMNLLRSQNNDNDLINIFLQRKERDYFKFFDIEPFDVKLSNNKITEFGFNILNLRHNKDVEKIVLNLGSYELSNENMIFLKCLFENDPRVSFSHITNDNDLKDLIIKNNINLLFSNKMSSIEQLIIDGIILDLCIPINGYTFEKINGELLPLDTKLFELINEKEISFHIVSLINNNNKICG